MFSFPMACACELAGDLSWLHPQLESGLKRVAPLMDQRLWGVWQAQGIPMPGGLLVTGPAGGCGCVGI